MIHPSHPVTPSGGTGPVAPANTLKSELQKTHGHNKMTDPRHRYKQICRSTLNGARNFERQAIGQPSLEPLSPKHRNPPALSSLSDLSPLQLALTAATNLGQSRRIRSKLGWAAVFRRVCAFSGAVPRKLPFINGSNLGFKSRIPNQILSSV